MGLKDVRNRAVVCLKSGKIQHETDRSGNIDEKNLLVTGQVTPEEVIEQLKKTKGDEYESSLHHNVAAIEVHIFRPKGWYIKFYFVEPNVFFISVHGN